MSNLITPPAGFLALLTVTAALVASCGGDDSGGPTSDRDEIIALVESYREALQERDSERICHEFLPPSMFEPPHERLGPGRGPGPVIGYTYSRCEQDFTELAAREGTPHVNIKKVEIDDGHAVAYGFDSGYIELVKEGGQWYLGGFLD